MVAPQCIQQRLEAGQRQRGEQERDGEAGRVGEEQQRGDPDTGAREPQSQDRAQYGRCTASSRSPPARRGSVHAPNRQPAGDLPARRRRRAGPAPDRRCRWSGGRSRSPRCPPPAARRRCGRGRCRSPTEVPSSTNRIVKPVTKRRAWLNTGPRGERRLPRPGQRRLAQEREVHRHQRQHARRDEAQQAGGEGEGEADVHQRTRRGRGRARLDGDRLGDDPEAEHGVADHQHHQREAGEDRTARRVAQGAPMGEDHRRDMPDHDGGDREVPDPTDRYPVERWRNRGGGSATRVGIQTAPWISSVR